MKLYVIKIAENSNKLVKVVGDSIGRGDKMEFSNGNHKIGKDTLIFNMTPATHCPSKTLGMCKLPGKCYAMKAERMYKQVLPYRIRQENDWDNQPVREIALEIIGIMLRKKKNIINYVRFNESGDFKDQQSVAKLKALAMAVPNVTFYGFTARKDLDFINLPPNLVINGSGFMIDNSFTATSKEDAQKHDIVCSGDCRKCDNCKTKGGRDIAVVYH